MIWFAEHALLPAGVRANVLLEADDEGRLTLVQPDAAPPPDVKPLPGLITPGLVNAHCHLELSHLAGRIAEGVGFVDFARRLMRLRNDLPYKHQQNAALRNAQRMASDGVVAVGDIGNTFIGREIQDEVPQLHIHTFHELFNLNPQAAEQVFASATEAAAGYSERVSLTPHAPYTVPEPLMTRIAADCLARQATLSFHFLESMDELRLFVGEENVFTSLFAQLGVEFSSRFKHPTDFLLATASPELRLLLIHCVEITPADLDRIAAHFSEWYICLCPKANWFIQHRLPPFHLMDWSRVCFGTDSLAGNDALDILEELRVTQQQCRVSTPTLLQCATKIGARALGLADVYGTLEVGKKCGLNQLAGVVPQDDFRLGHAGELKRLV